MCWLVCLLGALHVSSHEVRRIVLLMTVVSQARCFVIVVHGAKGFLPRVGRFSSCHFSIRFGDGLLGGAIAPVIACFLEVSSW